MENKIYVGTYHKYNCGSIAGDWIDVTNLTKDEFFDMCQTLHHEEKDPEFMFQDFEVHEILKDFVSEGGIDPEFWEIQEQIKEMSEEQIEALNAYQNIFGSIDIKDFEDRFHGHFEGFFGNIDREFGEHILEEMGYLNEVPEHLRYYIDAESYGRDLLMSDFTEFDGFVFRNY